MAKTISKLSRLSDLPEITHIWDGMKSIVAYNGSNYIIDTTKLKGKRIADIFGSMSTESGGENIIYIRFDNGTTEKLVVYNGEDGDKGKTGIVGPIGEQGDSAVINYRNSDEFGRGVVGVIYIINNSSTDSDDEMWSSLMGKTMNDSIYNINETFLTQEEYENLFENVKYIYAEFVTKEDNKEAILFNNDTNDHVIYKKYWTYEEGDIQTYYIKRNDGSYDAVNVSLWDDIYLGENEGYFSLTSSMKTQDIPIYYFDKQTNEYKEVQKIYIDDSGNETTTPTSYYIGDKLVENYYVPELDATLYSQYSASSSSWKFTLNSGKDLTWTIYGKETEIVTENIVDDFGATMYDEDGYPKTKEVTITNFYPLTVYYDIRSDKYYIEEYNGEMNVEVDPDQVYEFYSKENEESLITRLNRILTIPSVRYYRRDTNTNLYNEVVENDYDEFDDYLIVSKNIYTGETIFERHYSEEIYNEMVSFVETVTIKEIDLYYSTLTEGAREYYTIEYSYTDKLDEDGNIIEGEGIYSSTYVKINIPIWIVAEFVTKDEDVDALILNANENLGEEDNYTEDTTIEDLNDYVQSYNIEKIVPGNHTTIYTKDALDKYHLVNLNKDSISDTEDYYLITNRYEYEEVTGEYVIDNSIVEVYQKNETTYSIYRGTIIDSNVYYIRKNVYELIEDVHEYLSEYTINLIYGQPQLLPINIYPISSYRECVNIEYDPNVIKFFEDGRIAATIGDTVIDSKIYIRSEKNPDTVYAIVHVNLLTPVEEIKLDSSNIYETMIGNSVEIKYSLAPDNCTNKNISWVSSNPDAVDITEVDENIISINGISAGNYVLTGTAADGIGATINVPFEVITPATNFSWDLENQTFIKYVPPKYYTLSEIYEHNIQNPDDVWEMVENTYVLEDEYYYADILHNKEYELKPIIEPDNVIYSGIIWRSEAAGIASVNNSNILVGAQLGSTIITGTLSKFEDIDPIELRVNVKKAITAINITPEAVALKVNSQKILTATISPDDLSNAHITWTSSDENVVKVLEDKIDPVSNTAVIETVGIGSAIITVQGYDGDEISNISATSSIVSTIPAVDINVTGENISDGIIYVGSKDDDKNTATINALVIRDANYSGSDEYKLGVNWSVVDENIATVSYDVDSDKGLSATITGNNIGRTTLIASAADGSGVFGTIYIQVIKLTENVSFNLDMFEKNEDGKILMNTGDSIVLVPEFSPESTNEIVNWQSSDISVAKVKESGIVYALSSGEVTITVTTTDGSGKYATCEILIQ